MRKAILALVAVTFLLALPTVSYVYARSDAPLEFVARTHAPIDRERANETMVTITVTVRISSVECNKPYTISLKWNAVPRSSELLGERSVSELEFVPGSYIYLRSVDELASHILARSQFTDAIVMATGRSMINLGTPGEATLLLTPPAGSSIKNVDLSVYSTFTFIKEASIGIPFCVKM